MASLRLQPVVTSTTAIGTVAGLLTLASTVGITRHAVLQVDAAGAGGWMVEVVKVIDVTKLIARQCGFTAASPVNPPVKNPNDLTVIPNGATVYMTEQWVADLYNDDIPDSLSLPTK